MDLKDKVIFITGSSNGIGKETAVEFAKRGGKVVVSYNNSEEDGEKVLKECEKFSEVLLLRVDVKSEDSMKEAVEEIINRSGGIDILVNNAGILLIKPFAEQTLGEIENQVFINLLGVMKMTRLFLPHLEKRKEAIIVNVASIYSKVASDEVVSYCATKFGVRGFTQGLAQELPNNVKTYCVNPGLTATRITNFEGVSPKKVAEVIVDVCEKSDKESGSDIGIPD